MQLIPFESAKAVAKSAPIANPFAAVASIGGFPSLSNKGSKWHVVRGDSRETLLREVDGDKIPATTIEVVILSMNPNKSYTFFKEGYQDGSSAGPVCFSNDAASPDVNAKEPQAKKCDLCPHRVWGSKVYDNGKKGRSCEESVRMAVAPLGQVNDAMLLRVKAGSFNNLREFGEALGRHGKHPWQVGTKIGFDHDAAYPLLTFKPLGVLPPQLQAEVDASREMEVVKQIIGTVSVAHSTEYAAEADDVAPPKPEKAVEEKAAKAAPPKAAKTKTPEPDEFPAAPKEPVTVGKKAAKPTVEDVADEVGEMVESSDDLEFDD